MSRPDRSFAFVGMPALGHIAPTLPVVAELVRRGHRVRYATGAGTAALVRAAGAEPVPAPFVMPADSAADPSDPITRVEAFAESVERTFPVLHDRFAADPPSAVCGDAMTPVAALLARRLAVPFVALHPTFASNRHFSLRDDVMAPASAVFREAFRRIDERIERLARSQGLPLDGVDGFSVVGDLNLVFLPRDFQPAGDTFDGSFHFVGPSLGTRAVGVPARERRDPPLLLVSLGTVFNQRPDFFRTCAEAFAGSRWRVVMAIGDRVDPRDLDPLPSNIEVHPSVPQVELLSAASAFVTHHGMNSTMEAMLLGVPQVGLPQMPEQELIARRVAELGCGRRLDAGDLDAAGVRATVEAVAGDPAIRSAVDATSRRLVATDGPSDGADALESLVGA